jgi:hypothetical protein
MPRRRSGAPEEASSASQLEHIVQEAVAVAKKARKHHQNLEGDNFYANKLAALRADATNLFREFASTSPGDVSALAESIERVFAPRTPAKDRATMARELLFSLRTTWKTHGGAVAGGSVGDLFPLSVLSQAKRGYLVTVGRQMNGCLGAGWHDATLVMMRRLLEISIIEAFEAKGEADQIKDGSGNYLQLSDLVARALACKSMPLSRNTRKHLPDLRDLGHMSAHGRYFTARREDVDRIRQPCRVAIEEFLHHAGLLQ